MLLIYLNPLEIGSNCNVRPVFWLGTRIGISIPLKSGLIVIEMKTWLELSPNLNPLEIGSNCNGAEQETLF